VTARNELVSVQRLGRLIQPLSINPFADIGRTILELDAIRFAARQKLHCISNYERYVLQIQDQVAIDPFQSEESLQLRNVVHLDSTTYGEDGASVS